MSFKIKHGFCSKCNKNVKVEIKTPNHVLHLLLTFFTAGLWGIVWIILTVIPHDKRCAACGSFIPYRQIK